MTDPDATPKPTALDHWFARQQANAPLRSTEAIFERAGNLTHLYRQLQALTPFEEGQNLADIADREGQWGLSRITHPTGSSWTLALRLPVLTGFLLLTSDGTEPVQLQTNDSGPEGQKPRRWKRLKQTCDLNVTPHTVYTLNPEQDARQHGYTVAFLPLRTLPGPKALSDRPAVPVPERPNPGLKTRYTLVGLLNLVSAGLMLMFGPATFAFLAGLLGLVCLGFGLFLHLHTPSSADQKGQDPSRRFWTDEEQAELVSLRSAQIPPGPPPTLPERRPQALPGNGEGEQPMTKVRKLAVPDPTHQF